MDVYLCIVWSLLVVVVFGLWVLGWEGYLVVFVFCINEVYFILCIKIVVGVFNEWFEYFFYVYVY